MAHRLLGEPGRVVTEAEQHKLDTYDALVEALAPLAAFYDTLTESDLENERTYSNVAIYARGNANAEVALNVADILAACAALAAAKAVVP